MRALVLDAPGRAFLVAEGDPWNVKEVEGDHGGLVELASERHREPVRSRSAARPSRTSPPTATEATRGWTRERRNGRGQSRPRRRRWRRQRRDDAERSLRTPPCARTRRCARGGRPCSRSDPLARTTTTTTSRSSRASTRARRATARTRRSPRTRTPTRPSCLVLKPNPRPLSRGRDAAVSAMPGEGSPNLTSARGWISESRNSVSVQRRDFIGWRTIELELRARNQKKTGTCRAPTRAPPLGLGGNYFPPFHKYWGIHFLIYKPSKRPRLESNVFIHRASARSLERRLGTARWFPADCARVGVRARRRGHSASRAVLTHL